MLPRQVDARRDLSCAMQKSAITITRLQTAVLVASPSPAAALEITSSITWIDACASDMPVLPQVLQRCFYRMHQSHLPLMMMSLLLMILLPMTLPLMVLLNCPKNTCLLQPPPQSFPLFPRLLHRPDRYSIWIGSPPSTRTLDISLIESKPSPK